MNCFFCQGKIYKKYKKRDLIKKTPFSHVYLSNPLDNLDSKCIIKIQNRYKHLHNISLEIKILKLLQSLAVTPDLLYDEMTCIWNYQVFKYIDGVTLDEYLRSGREKKYLIPELLSGFKEIQCYKIIHRDIKLDNIMIENNHIKIIDFGLSCYQSDLTQFNHTECAGTRQFMCPEMFSLECYNAGCDTWSLAILFYFIIMNEFPYRIKQKDLIRYQQFKIIPREILKFDLDIPKSNPYYSLITTMLIVNKMKRPLISDLLIS